MTPGEPHSTGEQAAIEPPEPVTAPSRWPRILGAALLLTFYLEAGFFLALFPWTHYARDFAAFRPAWRPYWYSTQVRFAISGLGLLNLYFGFTELLKLRRR